MTKSVPPLTGILGWLGPLYMAHWILLMLFNQFDPRRRRTATRPAVQWERADKGYHVFTFANPAFAEAVADANQELVKK